MRTTNSAAPIPVDGDDLDGGHRSVDHSAVARKVLDLRYGNDSEAQKLDLYLPDSGDGPFPLILFVHGGAFMMCDKADGQVQPYLAGTRRGYAVASVNYRLSGEAIFPAGIHDLTTALRFLRAHAGEYGLDPGRVAACGGSAGGNYAALLCALTGRHELEDSSAGYPEQSSDVQAGVVWYPPTDFLQMDAQLARSGLGPLDHNDADSPESLYLGGQITELPVEYVQRANPVTYVHRGMPPMLIQHGRKDHVVPWQQSELLVRAIEEVCGTEAVQYEVFENADHADRLFETEANMARVFAFLDRTLGRA